MPTRRPAPSPSRAARLLAARALPNVARQSPRTTPLLPVRVASVFLAVVMLANSTPAAPQVALDAGRGWKLNALLWFQASGWAATLQGLGQSRPPAQRQERQSEREARVRRVEIHPGELEVAVGERVQFTAVAYDGNDDPVGGIRFAWRGRDEGRGRLALVTREGLFEARATGNFKVYAEGAGRQAHVAVRVREGERRRHDEQPRRLRDVSTDDSPAEAAAGAKRQAQAVEARRKPARSAPRVKFARASFTPAPAPAAPAVTLPADDEYGWNSVNYMFARDPDNGRGESPARPIDDGAGNGNFQFAAPVISIPGRGIDLSLALVYNSRVWTKTDNQIIFDADRDWPAPGWSLGFGKIVGMGAGGSLIIDPDGTRHGFTGSVTQYSNGSVDFTGRTTDGTFIDYETYSTSAGIQSATVKIPNGTIIRYGAAGSGGVYPTSITDADGNYVAITYRNNAGPQIDVVTDTLGRTVKFYYDANNLLTAVEGPGLGGTPANPARRTLVRLRYRQLTLDYDNFSVTPMVRGATVWVPDAIYYPGTGTGYWFGEGSYSSYGMLVKVVEQRAMGFSDAPPTEMGVISEGQTTREQIYDYPLTPNQAVYLSDAPTYGTLVERWTTDGTQTQETTTTYSVVKEATNPSFPGVPSRKVEITRQPDGLKSIQYSYNYTNLSSTHPDKFKDGLVYHDETRDANNNLLSSSLVTEWQKGDYDSPRPLRTEVSDDRGQKTAAEYGYGQSFNQVEEVRDFDYGGTTPLRVTRTAYENSPHYTGRHIFSLVKSVEVFEPNGTTRLSRTEYQYDAGTLADTPGVVMHSESHNPYSPQYERPCDCEHTYNPQGYQEYVCHSTCTVTAFDPSTNYRGNVTQVKTYADAANLSGAITETRAYDRTGNLRTGSSSCCEQTTVTYTADTQYAYPTTHARGAATAAGPRVVTFAAYDFNTGLVKSATDADGREVRSFYYPQTLRPQIIYSATNARVEYTYDDAEMTTTETTYDADNVLAAQSVRRMDGNRQVRREEVRGEAANVWDVIETKYDVFGRVKEQSRPFREGAETPRWNKNFYDTLGRVTRAEAPDGSATESFYNEGSYPPAATQGAAGQTVRARDAWGRERWGRTDAQGRLVEVVEPNPHGGGAVSEAGALTTRYSYDTPGNLIEVAQGAQVRRFRYDSLGRMTHQKLAETSAALTDAGTFVGVGVGGAAWSDYLTYDERSNLVTRTDARGVVTNFSYTVNGQPDPLNRLQSVSCAVPAGSSIPSAAAVSYLYETDAAKDRTRIRQIVTAGVSTEALDYDSEGRLHQRTLTLDGRASYPFTTNYTYDSLHRVTDVTYPAQYGVAGAPRKVVHHDFAAAGRLSGLEVNGVSHASEIGYNASSQMTSLKVGAAGANQMTETYAYDPLTGLLAGQKVFKGADTAENRRLDLSYGYLRDGTAAGRTGHLTKVTDNRDAAKNRHYEYDPLGRLRRASAGAAAGSWAQHYLYDRYGNRSHVLSQKTSDWLTTLYNVVLNRAPDATGLATWESVLRNGYAQGQAQFLQAAKETAAGFFNSDEYVDRNRSNSDYVRDLYLVYLSREPDQGGWVAWVNALNSGASRQDVRAGLAESGEFANRVAGMYPGATAGGSAAPSGLSATANSSSQIALSWAVPASGAVGHYRVERRESAAGQYTLLATTTTAGHTDTQVNAETAYLYRVSAVSTGGSVAGVSNTALGTAVTFTDDPIAAGVTAVRALHLDELRRAVNAVRRLAGLADAQWTDAAQVGVAVRAAHVREMRERLNEALTALQMPTPSYTDATLVAGATIKAAHFNELRQVAVRAAGAAGGGGSPLPAAPKDGHAYLSFDPATNRINSPGWDYDAAGNQTRALLPDGVTWRRFEYDAANRLVRVKADDNQTVLAGYTYGDSNQRLAGEEAGARTYYAAEGGQVLAEYAEYGTQAAPQWAKSYVYLGGRLLSTLTPVAGGELVEHHHPDRLGAKVVTRPADGTWFEQAHLPFGNGSPSESGGATNRRFTSYDRSGGTGLDYAVNRRYDPMQGRFTQVDPIGAGATDIEEPQSWNMYGYCGNDPVNHADPEGLFFGRLFRWLGRALKWIAIAAAVAAAVITVVGWIVGPIALQTFLTTTTLGKILGFVANIPNVIGGFITGIPKTIAGVFSLAETGASTTARLIGFAALLGGGAAAEAAGGGGGETGKARRRREKRERREARERRRDVRVRLPPGVSTEPPRGKPEVRVPPRPQPLPPIDPETPRLPDNASRGLRWRFRLALLLKGAADFIKQRTPIIIVNPEAIQDVACKENPFSDMCINGPFPGCCPIRRPRA